MDPLSQGQLTDDGLPQSPSACGVPMVYDLSRRRRDSPVNPTTVGSLHMMRAPRWCGVSGGEAELPEDSSGYHSPMSAQQVRPDNAFSNTTVTLSYINRSHLHSTPKLHAVPSHSSNLSRRSPSHDSTGEVQVRESGSDGGAHRLQATNRHLGGVASRSERFKPCSKAPPMESARGGGMVSFTQQVSGLNGKHDHLRPSGTMRLDPCHIDSVVEGGSRRSRDRGGDRGGTLNGVSRGLWDLESCKGKPSKLRTVGVTRAEQRQSTGEAAHQGRTSRNLSSPINEDYISPLDEPLSPAVSSLDEMEDVLILPQTLHSPSAESSYAEVASADVAGVKLVAFVDVTSSPEDSCSSDSDVIEVPVTSNLTKQPAGAPRPLRKSSELEECPAKKKEWNHTVRQTEWRNSEECLNGNALGQGRAVERKKQLPLSRQGAARREAIGGNVTPFGSKLSSRTQSVKRCPEPETDQTYFTSLPRGLDDSAHNSKVETLVRDRDGFCTDRQKSLHSTSDSEDGSVSKFRNCSTSSPGLSTPTAAVDVVQMETRRPDGFPSQSCPRKEATKTSNGAKTQRRSRAKQPSAPSQDSRAAAKAKGACGKKRKKRKRASQPSAFCPQEPEIKLKYATYRDEKRDARAIAFTPYVRMDRKEFSTCTVVNYVEEENSRLKKARPWQTGSGLATGTVPATSYLELGRLDAEGRRQREEACCLCSGPANAMDLGDLHGPYRPHAVQPGPRAPADPQGPKEEEACSDSDSSYDGRDGKYGCGQVESIKPNRLLQGPKRDAALVAQCRWVCEEDSPLSPSAKRPWSGSDPNSQHNTPRIALDTGEFWLHEDCGVWSMGVFLVRGKLYGLEEAVRLAQETDCSACQAPGATLGCFFKDCPSKYHYRCAVQSDCVLNEDNFTMKCTKHKNKSHKGVSRLENR